MELKKQWTVGYYRYNLTEWVEEHYFTSFIARLRAYWLCRNTGWRIYVRFV
jgi:hypothetical protein